MKCQWVDHTNPDGLGRRRVRCKRCGLITNPTPHPHERIHSVCKRGGLGDQIAAVLESYGISKELVSKIRGKRCGCASRQELINRLGWWAWDKTIAKLLWPSRKPSIPTAPPTPPAPQAPPPQS